MQTFTFKVRVDAIRDEAQDIRSFRIVRLDGLPFDVHEPGAHIDVTAPSGITRQYSLCGDPAERGAQLFAVKKEAASRGGSRSLHDDVVVGSELVVSPPRNLFRLAEQARTHVLIGAGIGITPLLSMAYRLTARGTPFVLHYFARSEAHAAFLPTLSREPLARHLRLHFGVEPADLEAALHDCLSGAGPGTHVYTCGPGPFMDQVVEAGEAAVGADAVHLERFAAEPVAAAEGTLDSFEVQVAGSGRVVQVGKGQTIVGALAEIGIDIDTSCGEGVCGTCIVDVVDGEPDHRDHCLSKAERAANRVICCCVSRSRSKRIVLDV
ncbi:PDR/VanB family oxidoreductase [Burkholderia glumae]|uniref:PDR/VanB family oxidoreductase n=1 Tax=Burkholderia glumae TaxID=337 RepID=UPI002150BB20|nr:PDR/VanB family oxidoreductase [Burkholderia glumae]UVS97780.1 oxidoreductase [Burkholderia glumae]